MAAADFFLKIDGIKGEATDSKHKSEIDIESWSWGQSNSGSHTGGGGGGAGKVVMQDFNFTMKTNQASPELFLACANGAHIKEATLVCRKAGKEQQEYLKIKFNDLLISSYQTGGAAGSSVLPTDQISFNFAKIEISYAAQNEKGGLAAALVKKYDLKTQTGG